MGSSTYIVYKYINQTDTPSEIKFVGSLPKIAQYLSQLKSYHGQTLEEISETLTSTHSTSTTEGDGGHYIIPWTPSQPLNHDPIPIQKGDVHVSGHFLVEYLTGDDRDVFIYEYNDLAHANKQFKALADPIEEDAYITLYHISDGDKGMFKKLKRVEG